MKYPLMKDFKPDNTFEVGYVILDPKPEIIWVGIVGWAIVKNPDEDDLDLSPVPLDTLSPMTNDQDWVIRKIGTSHLYIPYDQGFTSEEECLARFIEINEMVKGRKTRATA